jgi:hypothetical protein
MGYHDDDRYGGGNRWRDRDDGRSNERGYGDRDREWRGGEAWDEGRRERMGWGSGAGREGEGRRSGGDDRGFFERAGEGVRSWFRSDDDGRRGYERDDGRDHGGGTYGWMSGGWGNQAGESWNRDRPGVRNEREGWFTDSVGGERGQRPGGSAGRQGSGYDPLYSQWRQRQMEELDRDYEEFRREHQSKFEQEFGSWRSKRQGQRQMLGRVGERMEVVGSDGTPVGTVDKVEGDRILLAQSGESAGGMRQSVPCSWVETIDENRVTLNRTSEQAMDEWREEERSRALFERRGERSEGPHVLNRSFSGTYKDDDR